MPGDKSAIRQIKSRRLPEVGLPANLIFTGPESGNIAPGAASRLSISCFAACLWNDFFTIARSEALTPENERAKQLR
jgi:hypothetical protein